jgi:class 3 adenylate cyclase
LTCPACGEENPDRAKFCLNCGAALGAGPGRLEERKLVSVLFVDLVGFTARSDRADPEDVRDLLQEYHAKAKEEIERFGGIAEKFIGDAVMAVFGAPTAHGDDAERAVRAGLGVLAALEDLNREQPGLELAARAAVNTGEAVVTIGGGPAEPLALGDAINEASRLQAAAPAGHLIVGAETYRATRGVIDYEPLAAVDAKGKPQPLETWLALAPKGGPAERPAGGAPFVGRERELDLLASIWERAVAEQRPHAVTVIGPPGIGKSRLTHEVAARIEANGGRVVWGTCLPYDERTGYRGFADQLRQVAGIYESDAPEAARRKLDDITAQLLSASEGAEVARSLSTLLGLGTDEPVMDQIMLFFAARRVVEALSDERPTLFVMQDLHWADGALLDLLQYLFSHVRDRPAVFLANARPELLDLRPTWGSGLLSHSSIPLEPLSADESGAIAAHLLTHERGAQVERLVATAEGNPLFLEELAASIMERAGDGERDLPTTIRSAIASRIDALPAGPRAVLLDASVVGRTFWRGALRALRDDEDLEQELDALESRDLIRRDPSSQLEGDAQYRFKHALVRDTAYGTLPRAGRRRRHALVAGYVEETFPTLPGSIPAILAHHWRQAGEAHKAIECLLVAARRAQHAWAEEETMDLFARAIELADTDEERRRLRLLRGIALTELEDFEQANEALAELIPELEGRDLLEALLAKARAAHWTEQTEETMARSRRALDLAERLGAKELVAPATARLSQAYSMRGAEGDLARAIELGQRALETWPRGERTSELAEHMHLFANPNYWRGDYERALEVAQAGVELATDPNSAESLLRLGGLAGLAMTALGRYEEAFDLFDRQMALARDLGRPYRTILNYSTAGLRDVYDVDEARRRTEEALSQGGWSGFLMPQMNAVVDRLFNELVAGDLESAQALLPTTWEEVRKGMAWEAWLLAGRTMAAQAEIELLTGRLDDALQTATRALEAARRVGRRKYEVVARTILGNALMVTGDPARAATELRAAAEIADALGSPPARWQPRWALGRALYASGDDEGAELALREAEQVIQAVAESLAPERAARFLQAQRVQEALAAAAGRTL